MAAPIFTATRVSLVFLAMVSSDCSGSHGTARRGMRQEKGWEAGQWRAAGEWRARMTPKGEAKKKQIPQPRSRKNRGTGFGMTAILHGRDRKGGGCRRRDLSR